jgi:hypothetical protein
MKPMNRGVVTTPATSSVICAARIEVRSTAVSASMTGLAGATASSWVSVGVIRVAKVSDSVVK